MIDVLHISDTGQPWFVGNITLTPPPIALLPSSLLPIAENSNIEHDGLWLGKGDTVLGVRKGYK